MKKHPANAGAVGTLVYLPPSRRPLRQKGAAFLVYAIARLYRVQEVSKL